MEWWMIIMVESLIDVYFSFQERGISRRNMVFELHLLDSSLIVEPKFEISI